MPFRSQSHKEVFPDHPRQTSLLDLHHIDCLSVCGLFLLLARNLREDWGQEKCVQRCDLGAWPEKMLSEVVQCVCEAQRADVTCPKSHR